ncbi:S8 family peptidase [Geminisphaera colitermitum]|uniref:S8 family peptidase n=1 Tax=Geminisphaera colitermitum TaxID=1148786 RepID=UPI000158CC05|nr:S8 family peptidase [Geminisphaera colitermitum]
MNPSLPPLLIAPLPSRRLKPPPKRPVPAAAINIKKRIEAAQNMRRQLAEIEQQARQLDSDQIRAIILKMTHDRRLTKNDLSGTGLCFYAPPTDTHSLVIPKNPDELNLHKIDQRIAQTENNPETPAPPNINFLLNVTSVTISDPKERLCEQFRKNYKNLSSPGHWFIYEVEISSFLTDRRERRKELRQHLTKLQSFLRYAGGGGLYEHDDNLLDEGVIPAVVSSTGSAFQLLVEAPEWRRIVTSFDARPKFETFSERFKKFTITDTTLLPPPENAPKICVIDTGVAGENPFLKHVVNRDLSESWITGYHPLADPDGHGSGVASLAAYYHIDIGKNTTHQPVAQIVSARITDDQGYMHVVTQNNDGTYHVKEAHLLSLTLEKIVEKLHHQGVRIYVLSYSIVGHIWNLATRDLLPRKTWVGRTIDRLAKKYDILFICITGNLPPHDIKELLATNGPWPRYLANPTAKLLDPGQASLALTVGAIAHSTAVTPTAAISIAIARENEASPFTRTGPGFGEAIKPDLVEYGGNFVQNAENLTVSDNSGTDVIMASGQLNPPLQHNSGTSFAGPRAAYHAAQILSDLRQLQPEREPSACLLRAFLAASATPPATHNDPKLDIDLYGHGQPDIKKATHCEGYSTALYYDASHCPGDLILLPIDIPKELATAGHQPKKIRIAVAMAPPVQSDGLADYHGVKLKFRLFRGDKKIEDIREMMSASENLDTTLANIKVAEELGHWKIETRSVGTLQSDTFVWTRHKDTYSQHPYILAIALYPAQWLRKNIKTQDLLAQKISLAAVIRVEDTSQKYTQLYAQQKAAIDARAQEQARARQRIRATI